GYSVPLTGDKYDPVRLGLENARTYDPKAPSVRICLARMLAEHVGRGIRAGFPFFELDHFIAEEVHHLSQMDVVIVASRWAASVARANGITVPTAVAPLGVDRSVFHESIAEATQRPRIGPTVFVNTGKWERRKGHDFLLAGFCNAFGPRDQV